MDASWVGSAGRAPLGQFEGQGGAEFLSDAQIEHLLLEPSARSETALREIFDSHELAALRALAKRASDQRATRKLPNKGRVLIVPGVQGTKLGTPRAGLLPPRLVWIGPSVLTGALKELSLDEPVKRHGPLGVFAFVYLRCKLQMQALGYDASFFPYDWRESAQVAARELVRVIRERDEPVKLIAHSMGGLVARLAIAELDAVGEVSRVRRCVMVGTPHAGAPAAILALRGTFGLVDWLHRFDLAHTSEELARDVWASFPSVYELLPQDCTLQQLLGAGAPAREELLKQARGVHAKLPVPDGRMCVLAGTGMATPTRVRVQSKGMSIERSKQGDGTVPLGSAVLQGVQSTVLQGVSHTDLVRSSAGVRAIVSMLAESAQRTRTSAHAKPRVQSVRPVAKGPAGVVRCVGAPAYLVVRAQRTPTHRLLRASVLLPRAGASVPAGGALLSHEQLRNMLALHPQSMRPRNAAKLGEGLAMLALPAVVRDALSAVGGPLVLLLDREASALPWETMRLPGAANAMSLERVVTRVLECASLEDEDEESTRGASDEGVRALVIANPTQDLSAAKDEGESVQALLESRGVRVSLLAGSSATRARVQQELANCPSIVHFAGHAHFDSAAPHRSGMSLADGMLTSGDLRKVEVTPRLVLLNACESARTRGPREHVRSVGVPLAEAIIRSGVRSVVGTWWPVLDRSAILFAQSFYEQLFSREAPVGVGEAVRRARQTLASSATAGIELDSVNYVLYGQTGW
jgi:hypothetical protein